MPKHTAGPWVWKNNHPQDGERFDRIDNAEGEAVLDWWASESVGDAGIDVRPEDARLIAAAPELLEELEAMTDGVERMAMRLDKDPGNQTVVSLWLLRVKQARAAIAKAEGQEPPE